jgi:hypothetical protein
VQRLRDRQKVSKGLFSTLNRQTPFVARRIRPHVESDGLAIREGERKRVLFLDSRSDSADLGVTTKEAEQVPLPGLPHVVIDMQTDFRFDAGARARILKLPQP